MSSYNPDDDTVKGPAAASSRTVVSLSEVTGLQSAIAYAQGSAAAAERAAAQDEAAIAALQAGGTTGPAVTALQASMEQHQKNAMHYRTAEAELQRHIGVKEAYHANPDAGTKAFVTAE